MRMQLLIVLAFSGVPASAMDVVGIAGGDTLTVLQDGRPARSAWPTSMRRKSARGLDNSPSSHCRICAMAKTQ